MLGRTPEEAMARYRKTGMVQHRQSLAHTGRDPALAEANNLIGSPASVLDKIAWLAAAGVDHLCALQFPHDSVSEMLEQIEWFAGRDRGLRVRWGPRQGPRLPRSARPGKAGAPSNAPRSAPRGNLGPRFSDRRQEEIMIHRVVLAVVCALALRRARRAPRHGRSSRLSVLARSS
jgi:hypothetical protein